jgi:hypothetical protein
MKTNSKSGMAAEQDIEELSRSHQQQRSMINSTSKQVNNLDNLSDRPPEQSARHRLGEWNDNQSNNGLKAKPNPTALPQRGSGSGTKLEEEGNGHSKLNFANFIDDLAKGLQERTDTVFAEFGEFQKMSGKRFPQFEKMTEMAHQEMLEDIDIYADKLERYSYNLFLGGRTDETTDIIEDYLQGKRTRLAFCDDNLGVDIDTIKNSVNEQLELLQENKRRKVLEKYESHLSAAGARMKETLLEKIVNGKVDDMDDLVLYLDRKNLENTEFMFNFQCSFDHLKARINKL